MHDHIVSLQGVTIDYQMRKYDIRAVTDVDLSVWKGKITALVGESGSGKSTLASSIIGSLAEPGVVTGGHILFSPKDGPEVDVTLLEGENLRRFKWEKVSMVFQAAQSALNPVMTVYQQFSETCKDHNVKSDAFILARSKELLTYVHLDPERVLPSYPHELSGGMKQRVMIAFAMLLNPSLIILDEPTTALDVITQDYIFTLLRQINRDFGISMLLLTHDIGVVAKYSDYVGVMYAGRIMEYGTTAEVFKRPLHPYTKGLIHATPSLLKNMDSLQPIDGTPPDLRNLPSGCPFWPRCQRSRPECRLQEPGYQREDHHISKCFYSLEKE